MPDAKRFVLFLVGTAMLIDLVVEILVVRGDIGRMNTVFKFYLQGWALLSVSAAAAFAWLLPALRAWNPGWRNVFQAGAGILLAGAALFTISAGIDKVSDRMAGGVPLTLDSMTYMQHAQYADFDVLMNLDQDYGAIRWMQDNVQGSPAIVEANCPEYRWCTRFTIYTGLPGVVGWNWHQRQQRTLTPQLVEQRVTEVGLFYSTTDTQEASDFLRRYNVRYIVVGQLERARISRCRVGEVRHIRRHAVGRGISRGRNNDLQGALVNIYHITSRRAWIEATRTGSYAADSLHTEGFIHCSTAAQVLSVAEHFYAGQNGLVLLVVDPKRLEAPVKWEQSVPPKGVDAAAAFPHVYGPIGVEAVSACLDFEPDEGGQFALPALPGEDRA